MIAEEERDALRFGAADARTSGLEAWLPTPAETVETVKRWGEESSSRSRSHDCICGAASVGTRIHSDWCNIRGTK